MRGRWVAVTVVSIAVVLIALLVWFESDQWIGTASLDAKDRYLARAAAATVAVQSVGGTALFVGLILTWRQLLTAREGQITDRFTRAVEQLGSEKLEVRLGAIYALERIARDSERDHWPVMEILTAFVRQHAPNDRPPTGMGRARRVLAVVRKEIHDTWHQTTPTTPVHVWGYNVPRPDIQAAMTVIGRRSRTYQHGERLQLNLRDVNLSHADLEDAHLEGVQLAIADLRSANLERATLRDAVLVFARLDGARITGADLRGTFGLNWEQVHSAEGWQSARLPDNLKAHAEPPIAPA